MELQVLLIPPLLAIAIYIAFIHFVIPLYRKRQLYAQYLPVSLGPSADGFVDRTRGRVREAVADFFGHRALFHIRRSNTMDTELHLGDEELEEGVLAAAVLPGTAPASERRLSRDLEAGFRDDSDDDESDERGQRGVLGR